MTLPNTPKSFSPDRTSYRRVMIKAKGLGAKKKTVFYSVFAEMNKPDFKKSLSKSKAETLRCATAVSEDCPIRQRSYGLRRRTNV